MNFLFDNNLAPALAQALRTLGKPVSHVREIAELGAAAPDDLILDHAVQWSHVVITRDRAMRRTPHFKALIRSRRLGVVFVKTGEARQLTAWEIAKLVVRAWDDIERFASLNSPPFIALVQRNARVIRV